MQNEKTDYLYESKLNALKRPYKGKSLKKVKWKVSVELCMSMYKCYKSF